MAKNVYGQSGALHHKDNCCTANTGCITPETYDPEVIVSECIFVEKVYDSVVIKDETDEVVSFNLTSTDLGFCVPTGSKILKVTVNCTTKPKGGSTGTTVTPTVLTINGVTPPVGPTPTGPGGIEQIDLSFIDTSECDELGRGTPIIVDQEITVAGEVLVTISGTILLPDKTKRTFCNDVVIDFDDFTLRKFVKLCIPSTFAAMKPSLAEFCAILCDFVLPLGTDSLTPDGSGGLDVNGILVLCLICEKKVKVPVQLCVLSTGFCDQQEQGGLCVEFPRLFPEQVNVEVIE
ncbi:hypothetical protein [Wukongibacter sp. M2B1]|uniref:hypothetical protein n=1 Tax=Wukongibacter sp. M2B1 TaxID=3088895 RepID=UPI003D79FC12